MEMDSHGKLVGDSPFGCLSRVPTGYRFRRSMALPTKAQSPAIPEKIPISSAAEQEVRVIRRNTNRGGFADVITLTSQDEPDQNPGLGPAAKPGTLHSNDRPPVSVSPVSTTSTDPPHEGVPVPERATVTK